MYTEWSLFERFRFKYIIGHFHESKLHLIVFFFKGETSNNLLTFPFYFFYFFGFESISIVCLCSRYSLVQVYLYLKMHLRTSGCCQKEMALLTSDREVQMYEKRLELEVRHEIARSVVAAERSDHGNAFSNLSFFFFHPYPSFLYFYFFFSLHSYA